MTWKPTCLVLVCVRTLVCCLLVIMASALNRRWPLTVKFSPVSLVCNVVSWCVMLAVTVVTLVGLRQMVHTDVTMVSRIRVA